MTFSYKECVEILELMEKLNILKQICDMCLIKKCSLCKVFKERIATQIEIEKKILEKK